MRQWSGRHCDVIKCISDSPKWPGQELRQWEGLVEAGEAKRVGLLLVRSWHESNGIGQEQAGVMRSSRRAAGKAAEKTSGPLVRPCPGLKPPVREMGTYGR